MWTSKKLLLLFSLLLCTWTTIAQPVEIGFFAGATAYQGDLAPSRSRGSLSEYHSAYGFFGRVYITPFLAIKPTFLQGKISGHDQFSKDIGRLNRNLSFHSELSELGLLAELNFPLFQIKNRSQIKLQVFGGLSRFKFNPTTFLAGKEYELQPLGTEGQGMPGRPAKYNLNGFAIPAGIGFSIGLDEHITIGIELSIRKTFTDYLDDVSTVYIDYDELLESNGTMAALLSNRRNELGENGTTAFRPGAYRGDPTDNDSFVFFGLAISVALQGDNHFRKTGRMGCPGK